MNPPLIGVSESIKEIKILIKKIAATGFNIIINGESGVGKEVVAQSLYANSPRFGKPFVKINCAALPEGLLESELFGYERGAFTGAERKKRGKFELADGGVLFLDEIGDMPILLQSKLLHVLQSGEFAPLGSERGMKTDTWVIAATNQDLKQGVEEKKFRKDLYYRLNTITIYIPPLRERPEDIPHLLSYYMEEYTSKLENTSVQLDDELIEKLMEYHWPGNIRELQNILKRILILGNWEQVTEELINGNLTAAQEAKQRSNINAFLDLEGKDSPNLASFSLKEIKKRAVNIVEKQVIAYVLDKTKWNRSKASIILKISYKTLLFKINELNIKPPAKSKKS